MDIYSTNNLIEVVRKAPAPGTFLRERFFPTSDRDIFKTKKVFIEREDDGNLAAPFVIPYTGSTLMERTGYHGEELMPAFLNPARDMSIDQLMKKGIGETLYDEVSPEEREQNYLADDLKFLQDSINRSWEWMCGQIICNGYVDCAINEDDKVRFKFYDQTFDNKMTFVDGSSNVQYWDGNGVSIYGQISDMANDIDAEYGDLDLVLGAQLVKLVMTDSQMIKMLDAANLNIGQINPDSVSFTGVGYLGSVNFSGKTLNMYSYNAKAVVNGALTSYFNPKYAAVMPRSQFGAMKFGSIVQMEQEDHKFHSYAAQLVPRVIADEKSETRRIEMKSAPLPHPYALDSWRVVQAIA